MQLLSWSSRARTKTSEQDALTDSHVLRLRPKRVVLWHSTRTGAPPATMCEPTTLCQTATMHAVGSRALPQVVVKYDHLDH